MVYSALNFLRAAIEQEESQFDTMRREVTGSAWSPAENTATLFVDCYFAPGKKRTFRIKIDEI